MSSCASAGAEAGGGAATGGGVDGSGDGEDVVKSSLVREEDGWGLIPFCSCLDLMAGELEAEENSGG
jgi:hypothetical protein